MRLVLAAALLLAALPARADPAGDADAVESCMRDAWPRDPRALCVGIVSAPCQRAVEGAGSGPSTGCLTRETAAWDTVMNRQMPELLRRAQEIDAATFGANPGAADSIDTAAATQEAAQRAWLTYRDAECRSAYASWGAGGFREIAHSACLLDLTARRVVDFQARLVTGG